MSTTIAAFRDAFRQQAGKPNFKSQQTTGLSYGQWTQWFDMTPNTQPNVVAGYFKFSYTVSGTTITPVSGADQLDAVIAEVQVAPSPGTAPRSQAITRRGMEMIEQESFDVNYGYPRAAPPSTAGTYTPFLYVPIGGEAAAVRFQMASATAAYSAGTVVFNSVTAYTVEAENTTVVSFNEQNTPALGSGLQDMTNYISKNISPDLVVLVGESSSTVTQVMMSGGNGKLAINAVDVDAISNGAAAFSPITGAPFAGLGIAAEQIYPNIFQVDFAAATTHDVLEVQYSGSTENAPQKPETTPATPASSQVGTTNAAGKPVPAGGTATPSRRPRF